MGHSGFLKKWTTGLWLAGFVALFVWLAGPALWPGNNLRTDFRDDVLAAAAEGRKAGKFRVDITEIVRERQDRTGLRDEIDLLTDLGLEGIEVVHPQQDLLSEFNAETYRGFKTIIDRMGIATYWEVVALLFYRDGDLTELKVFADYVSL